jgi:hypothetical protein
MIAPCVFPQSKFTLSLRHKATLPDSGQKEAMFGGIQISRPDAWLIRPAFRTPSSVNARFLETDGIAMVPSIRKMNCGISLGFNLSGWRGRIDEFIRDLETLTNYIGLSPNYSRSLRDGYEVGLFLCYRPISWMSIQSELNLMNQGLRIAGSGKISGNDYSIVQRFNVNYYQIPLILKFIEMKSGVYACAGAFVQYTISGKLTTEVTVDTEPDSNSKKIDNLSDRDYGYILGIGLDLSGGSFELRYITGLNEVFNPGTNDYGFRNYSIELRLEILLFSKHSR